MRRLKRTLGVTAIILALLVAMIPDVGRAEEDGDAGNFSYKYIGDINGLSVIISSVGDVTVTDEAEGDDQAYTYRIDSERINPHSRASGSLLDIAQYQFALHRYLDGVRSDPTAGQSYACSLKFTFYFDDDVDGKLYDYTVTAYQNGSVYTSEIEKTEGTGSRASVEVPLKLGDTDLASSEDFNGQVNVNVERTKVKDTTPSPTTPGTGGGGSVSNGDYSFVVNDDACYSDVLGKGGAYAEISPVPKSGAWVMSIADTESSALVAACVDPIVGMPEGAEYKIFQMGLTEDGVSLSQLPDKTTIKWYMPVPSAAEVPTLATAASFDLRVYKPTNDSAALVAEGLKPVADKKNKTSQKYLEIAVDNETYMEIADTPLILYASIGSTASSGTASNTNEVIAEVDTPKSNSDSGTEYITPGTTDDLSDLWVLGKPTATVNIPKDITNNYPKYRLLITQYTDLAAASIDDKIIDKSSITGYTKGKSKISAYEIQLKMIPASGDGVYPETPADLENRTVSITLPYQASQAGTVNVYTLKDETSLERIAGPVTVSANTTAQIPFTAEHFSQFALLYTPGTAANNDSGSSGNNSGSNNGGNNSGGNTNNNGTNNNNSNNSGSTASTAATGNSNAAGAASSNTGSTAGGSTGTTGNSTTGGGGNRAGGDSSVDMPRTADATTYKAIFILILLAFGAFELISSMPVKKKAAEQRKK